MRNNYASSCLFVLIYACGAYMRCENGVNKAIYTPKCSKLSRCEIPKTISCLLHTDCVLVGPIDHLYFF